MGKGLLIINKKFPTGCILIHLSKDFLGQWRVFCKLLSFIHSPFRKCTGEGNWHSRHVMKSFLQNVFVFFFKVHLLFQYLPLYLTWCSRQLDGLPPPPCNRFDNNAEEMNEIWELIVDFEMTRRQRKHAGHAFWNSFQLLNSNTTWVMWPEDGRWGRWAEEQGSQYCHKLLPFCLPCFVFSLQVKRSPFSNSVLLWLVSLPHQIWSHSIFGEISWWHTDVAIIPCT